MSSSEIGLRIEERATADEGVVDHDLDHVLERTAAEFEALAGGRVLLTGGAGFLGYYLLKSLVRWNETNGGRSGRVSVTVYDNFVRGVPPWLDRIRAGPGVRVRRHDVTEPVPPEDGPFDHVIHAASIASPTFYRQHPIQTMDANVGGLRALLDYLRTQQDGGETVRGVLFFSSSEIYGDPPPEEIPTPETYRGRVSCTGPRACYDESKRYGETLCVNFSRKHGLPIKIVRPFNNYGPGLKITDGRVLSDFARDILSDRDIVMLSDGSPSRTFCYVADALVGYYRVLVRGRDAEAYNIGADAPEVSVADLACRMRRQARELFGYTGQVIQERSEDPKYLADNPSRRCPDISKARRELDFSPRISLDEGIRRSLLWYASNPTGERA